MKKLFILVTCFVLLSTNLAFATKNDFTESIEELTNVDNRLYMIISEITGDDPLDKEALYKDIRFCNSILVSRSKIISNIYANNPDLEVARTCAYLLYTISLYELCLSNLNVYIDDDNKNSYFIDACSSYSVCSMSLKDLKLKNDKQTKVTPKPKCEESFN